MIDQVVHKAVQQWIGTIILILNCEALWISQISGVETRKLFFNVGQGKFQLIVDLFPGPVLPYVPCLVIHSQRVTGVGQRLIIELRPDIPSKYLDPVNQMRHLIFCRPVLQRTNHIALFCGKAIDYGVELVTDKIDERSRPLVYI